MKHPNQNPFRSTTKNQNTFSLLDRCRLYTISKTSLALTGFVAFFLSLLHLRLAAKQREKNLCWRAGSSH
jgi:hypothetical protein